MKLGQDHDYGVRELTFGPWTRWEVRPTLRTTPPEGGVYLFGYFRGPTAAPPPDPASLPLEVIYVGDAKDLNKRPLSNGHHVADSGLLVAFGKNARAFLYVSVGRLYVIDPAAKRYACQRAYSTYLENKLAWDYATLHGHPPVLSVKSTAANDEWIKGVISRLKAKP